MKRLALPLEVYPAVKHLNDIVKFPFTYLSKSNRRRNALAQPEAQLVSLIIVAVKLLFPFESATVKRYPHSLNEPAAQRVDWTAWIEARKNLESDGKESGGDRKFKKGQEIEVIDSDIFNMSDTQMDSYMDWYQRTWTKPADAADEDTSVRKGILDMFPLKPLPAKDESADATRNEELEQARLQVVSDVHSMIKMRRPIPDDEAQQLGDTVVNRPGMRYIRYRTVEELEGPAKAFYEAAAEVACLSLKSLVQAVMLTERRITILRNAKRRAERFGEEMDIEAEGGRVEEAENWMQRMDLVGDEGEGEGEEEGEEELDDEDLEMIE